MRINSALLLCAILAAPVFARAADLALIARMKQPDRSTIERRPKFLTDGSYDTADPSVPIRLRVGNSDVWTILFSGGGTLYAPTLEDFLKGGTHPLHDVRFHYPDGSPVTTKPYRINAAPWDLDLVSFRAADGESKLIGYAGAMEKRTDGSEPTRRLDNETRTRHAFHVVIKHEPGNVWEQDWTDLGSVQGYRPRNTPGHWLSETHAHGYGSHVINDANGHPFLFFEEVSEEKKVGDHFVPWKTELFARALAPDHTRTTGPKIKVLAVTAPTGRPFAASVRSNHAGHLFEGPHLIEAKIQGADFYLMFFSAGDAFTDRYGTFCAFRRREEGLFGAFAPILDKHGELIDITRELTERIDGTWGIGRLNPFRDDNGGLWGLGHVILKSEIPDGELKSGWPATDAQLIARARRTLLVPLELSLGTNGSPLVTVEREHHPATNGDRKAKSESKRPRHS